MSSVAARLAALGPLDPDAVRWANAVRAAGSTVSAARLALLSGLIVSLKQARPGPGADSVWTLTDDYGFPAAENSIQGLLSLKQLRLGTAINSPAFTADRGFTFDGATSYVDTGLIPVSHAVRATRPSNRLGVYNRTLTSSNGYDIGGSNSNPRLLQFRSRAAGGAVASYAAASAIVSSAVTQTNNQGWMSGQRDGAAPTPCLFFRNGVQYDSHASVSDGGSLPTFAIYLGCANLGGTPSNFRPGNLAAWTFGAPLSADMALAEYNAIQTYMTAIGAQV